MEKYTKVTDKVQNWIKEEAEKLGWDEIKLLLLKEVERIELIYANNSKI